ncbi:aminoacyl-tRNA hydrolase [Nitriliruptoraceae bacterium ZYF776]|nr:aminoacyl-tRNA hydrolase [Profundirhabdus halotolerans]
MPTRSRSSPPSSGRPPRWVPPCARESAVTPADGPTDGRGAPPRLRCVASLRISRDVSIPEAELDVRVSRSSGPGGQGVNTTDSKVELRWDVANTSALSETQRARVLERLGSRITKDGVLVLQASEERSQLRNREAAHARLRALVAEAITPPRTRRPTRRTRASKERRLRAKKQRSEVKKLRKPPSS